MQLYARVRRAVVVDKMSEREAARQFGLAVRLLYCFFVIEPGLRRDRAIAADSNRLSHQEGETSYSCFANTILTPQTTEALSLTLLPQSAFQQRSLRTDHGTVNIPRHQFRCCKLGVSLSGASPASGVLPSAHRVRLILKMENQKDRRKRKSWCPAQTI